LWQSIIIQEDYVLTVRILGANVVALAEEAVDGEVAFAKVQAMLARCGEIVRQAAVINHQYFVLCAGGILPDMLESGERQIPTVVVEDDHTKVRGLEVEP
jgi:hypothetical protein